MPRYTVSGIPPGVAARGLSAFLPHFTRPAASGAQRYKQAVEGQPGTRGIRVGGNPTPADRSAAAAVALKGAASSLDAPDVVYPNQYYQRYLTERPGAGMPIAVLPGNPPPVPAVNLRGGYLSGSARLSRTAIRRQQKQIAAHPRLPSWPGWPGGSGG